MAGSTAAGEHGSRTAGCLAASLGGALLVVLAPAAALVRAVQRRRRGSEPRVTWRTDARAIPGATAIDVILDLPPPRQEEARRALTDAVVRVAEALRRPDDVYHLVYREFAEPDTVMVPVGSQIQDLAERVHLALAHAAWAGRTLVWLVLPRSRPLAAVVPDLGWDPDAAGEPDALIARERPRWAFALAFSLGAVATEFRLRIVVPPEADVVVERHLERLQRALA